MSKPKGEGKGKSAEQPPRLKDHSPEQVKEVALMLYARRYAQDPFLPNNIVSKFRFNQLVRQANDLLDKLDVACEEVAKQRKADAQKPPPDLVPFNKAVMLITGEKHRHWDRAWERFKALPHITSILDACGSNSPVERMKRWRKQIAHWRKNRMARAEVEWLRLQYNEKAYRDWHSAGKRKHWGGEKIINAAPDSFKGFAKEMADKIGPDSLRILREMGPQREKSDKKRSKAQIGIGAREAKKEKVNASQRLRGRAKSE